MKKFLALLCCLILVLCGCAKKPEPVPPVKESKEEVISSVVESSQEEIAEDENKVYFPEREMSVPESIKILAIGNSFSVDAMSYLYPLLQDAGVKEITLGNLYMGGCSIKQHADNIQLVVAAYTYYKNTNGVWVAEETKTMDYGILDEDWDIITMQQASGVSGVDYSYARLGEIIDRVDSVKTNENSEYWWHMTWAYDRASSHQDFGKYDHDQNVMYDKIIECVKTKVSPTERYSGLIPCGTTMQNLRSFIGDNVTADGYHANEFPGRYALSMTWACALTGVSPYDLSWAPAGADESIVNAVKDSVAAAMENPLGVG